MIRKTAIHRVGLGLAAALMLAALAAPSAALATDPDPVGPPADATPTVVPHSTEAPTDGEIVYDGPFIDPTDDVEPDAGQPGDGDSPARPAITPPATDALAGGVPPAAGGAFLLLLASLSAATVTALHAGRSGLARRP